MHKATSFSKRHVVLSYVLTWIALCAALILVTRLSVALLGSRNINIDFGFLTYSANFDIANTAFPFSGSDSYAKALFIGFINTIKAAIACIILATVVGTMIGIARLSSNPLLRGCSGFLIELLRNVPPLLQLFAWSAVIQFALPLPRNAWEPLTGFFFSNRGLWFPFLIVHDHGSFATLVGGLLIGLGVVGVGGRIFTNSVPQHLSAISVALLAAGMILVTASGVIGLDIPERRGFNFSGGLSVTPEFAALVISLTLYTSGYIAEIVRGAVLAVPRGQFEAASALGFRYFSQLRLIILPQALRIAIPPMTNQYINVTKSTSLAVAVGFSDIVSVGNTIMNQSGRAIEIIVIFIAAYLLLNLIISDLMNRLNRRLALA